jgi:hypothetical protein
MKPLVEVACVDLQVHLFKSSYCISLKANNSLLRKTCILLYLILTLKKENQIYNSAEFTEETKGTSQSRKVIKI